MLVKLFAILGTLLQIYMLVVGALDRMQQDVLRNKAGFQLTCYLFVIDSYVE